VIWTAEREARLAVLWKEGRSSADIAKILGGVTRDAVIGKARRLGLSTIWTAAREARLAVLWKEGRPSADIAKILGGVTRNAVIGKARRLGLSTTPSVAATREQQRRRTAVKRRDGRAEAKAPVTESPAASPCRPAPPAAAPVSPVEVTDTQCRWPFGDPASPDFHHCGGPREADGLNPLTRWYCAAHGAFALNPTRARAAPCRARATGCGASRVKPEDPETCDVCGAFGAYGWGPQRPARAQENPLNGQRTK